MEKKDLKEAQKMEALIRLKKLNLHPNVIADFKKGVLNKSVTSRMGNITVGALYWVSDEEKKMIAEFEEAYNCVVYHIIESYTEFGKLLNFFYVSQYTDEWVLDTEAFDRHLQCVYVKNLDIEEFSEFGYIQYKEAYGGVVRVA